MKVRDAMTVGVVTAHKEDTVRSVVEKMIIRHCGSVPVINEDGDLVGVVAIRDVMLPLYPDTGDYIYDNVHAQYYDDMEDEFPKVLDKTVGEVMTAKPLTVSPEDAVLKAASFMGIKNLRRIPVTDGKKLVGIISIGDINRALFMAHINKLWAPTDLKIAAGMS
ncbi:MAG: CBS domain-containing protein [Bdellovibrionales bacterium]|nr:CBS domain-containing protein [Bdellovibrionales bacterium]